MMSKIKDPQGKKRQSYLHDCRNTYGESSKGSRKTIPRRKKQDHQVERHIAKEMAVQMRDSSNADELENKLIARTAVMRKGAWRKSADMPLSAVIPAKLKRRIKSFGAQKERQKRRAAALAEGRNSW